MFKTLIGLIEPIAGVASKVNLRKPLKQRVGKDCARLYMVVNEIIENGTIILDFIEKTQKGIKYNPSYLISQLFYQAQRINRLRSLVQRSHLQTVLRIHLPQLDDLEILVEMKGSRIAVLTKQLEDQKLKRFHRVKLYDSPDFTTHYWWSQTKIVPPTKNAVKSSRLDLAELKKQNRLLRKFIIDKFDVNEII